MHSFIRSILSNTTKFMERNSNFRGRGRGRGFHYQPKSNDTHHEKKEFKKPSPALDPSTPRPQIIDIGVNLTHKRFQHDLSQVIERALQNNVNPMILTGKYFRATLNLWL